MTQTRIKLEGQADVYNTARAYDQHALVMYTDNLLYAANSTIPANTAFAVGTSGATWRVVNAQSAGIETYDTTLAWDTGSFVLNDGFIFVANSAIDANTAFVEGSADNEWTRLNNKLDGSIAVYDSTKAYTAGSIVVNNNELYLAWMDVPASASFTIGNTNQYWRHLSPVSLYAVGEKALMMTNPTTHTLVESPLLVPSTHTNRVRYTTTPEALANPNDILTWDECISVDRWQLLWSLQVPTTNVMYELPLPGSDIDFQVRYVSDTNVEFWLDRDNEAGVSNLHGEVKISGGAESPASDSSWDEVHPISTIFQTNDQYKLHTLTYNRGAYTVVMLEIWQVDRSASEAGLANARGYQVRYMHDGYNQASANAGIWVKRLF